MRMNSRSLFVRRPRVTVTPETSMGEGGLSSSPDLSLAGSGLKLRQTTPSNVAQKKLRKMWRISAPLSDNGDSPIHRGVTSGNTTTTEDTDSHWEWESPNHGWHGVRRGAGSGR